MAPRFAVAWAPKRLRDTKLAAGWGLYYDTLSLEMLSRHQEQISFATFYPAAGGAIGPVATTFLVDDRALRAPYWEGRARQI